MQIQTFNFPNQKQIFKGKGKPLTLEYIVKKRKNLLPERVLNAVHKELDSNSKQKCTLMDLHKNIYGKLLGCKTLDEVKSLFPEFSVVKSEVSFKRDSIYAQSFKDKTGKNFVLKIIQDFWGNLKSKKEVANELGMPNRTSLDWALKNINFVSYKSNYLNLLKASDEVGNRIIASKTTLWNRRHPDLMREHNKQAAQSCKTKKYRQEQSVRMKSYDLKHPERIEKISSNNKQAWAICPEIRAALADFTKNQTDYVKNILRKHSQRVKLTEEERIIRRCFYKRFWDSHPEFKKVFAEAKRKVAKKQ